MIQADGGIAVGVALWLSSYQVFRAVTDGRVINEQRSLCIKFKKVKEKVKKVLLLVLIEKEGYLGYSL